MRDIPIIFSAPMVCALLDGRKTMTRRLAWLPPREGRITERPSPWQMVEPGDRLYVRESLCATWKSYFHDEPAKKPTLMAFYKADGAEVFNAMDEIHQPWRWERNSLPSIHMPRALSRLTLVVTGTKIEPLQRISEVDAKAEGCELFVPGHGWILNARAGFEDTWTTLHGRESWDANPLVVAITSKVVRQNIDRIAA